MQHAKELMTRMQHESQRGHATGGTVFVMGSGMFGLTGQSDDSEANLLVPTQVRVGRTWALCDMAL